MKVFFLFALLGGVTSVYSDAVSIRVKDIGFDPVDSTRFVQAALDSGARTVYLDRMASPWCVKPLVGRSNTELVFVNGAELQAVKGAFKGKKDALLTFSQATNVCVRGEGASGVMRMHHDDYLDLDCYERSEHRHGLCLFSVVTACVENMEIRETGGDGIILSKAYGRKGAGPCRDIVVRKCNLDGNLRQGISVITVDGLRMSDSVMSNTRGLNPMAGIDIEPNAPNEVCRNIVLENCRTFGNRGSGYELAFQAHNGTSPPIDVTLIGCTSDGDSRSLSFNGATARPVGNVSGIVTIRDCVFRAAKGSPFGLLSPRQSNVRMRFANSRFEQNGRVENTDDSWVSRNLLAFSPAAATLPTNRPKPAAEIRATDLCPGAMRSLTELKLRRAFSYAFYADRAKVCRFRGRHIVYGSYRPSEKPIAVCDAQGRTLASVGPFEGESDFSVAVPRPGIYSLVFDVGGCAFALTAADVPVAIDCTCGDVSVIESTGRLTFVVPENAERFGIYASSQLTELVGMRVVDPEGKTKWEDMAVCGWRGYTSGRRPASGIWQIELMRPNVGGFEDYQVDLVGVPGYLFLSEKGYWH